MHYQRLLEILAVGLSAVAVTEATLIDARLAADKGFAIKPRQNTGDTTVVTTPSSSSSSSTTPPPPPVTTTTPPPPPPVTTTPKTSSSSPTTPGPSQTPTPSTTPPLEPTSKPLDPPLSDVLTTITMVITTTGADGQQMTFTSQQTTAATAALAGGKNSSPSGMSTQTRNTVIGVVVGVGGAIILGGLAFVAWRIWGRKKGADENDNLMDYPSGTAEKPATGNTIGGTPFQSTLESYHAPTQVNQAKNF